jgi:hypothetical protein
MTDATTAKQRWLDATAIRATASTPSRQIATGVAPIGTVHNGRSLSGADR